MVFVEKAFNAYRDERVERTKEGSMAKKVSKETIEIEESGHIPPMFYINKDKRKLEADAARQQMLDSINLLNRNYEKELKKIKEPLSRLKANSLQKIKEAEKECSAAIAKANLAMKTEVADSNTRLSEQRSAHSSARDKFKNEKETSEIVAKARREDIEKTNDLAVESESKRIDEVRARRTKNSQEMEKNFLAMVQNMRVKFDTDTREIESRITSANQKHKSEMESIERKYQTVLEDCDRREKELSADFERKERQLMDRFDSVDRDTRKNIRKSVHAERKSLKTGLHHIERERASARREYDAASRKLFANTAYICVEEENKLRKRIIENDFDVLKIANERKNSINKTDLTQLQEEEEYQTNRLRDLYAYQDAKKIEASNIVIEALGYDLKFKEASFDFKVAQEIEKKVKIIASLAQKQVLKNAEIDKRIEIANIRRSENNEFAKFHYLIDVAKVDLRHLVNMEKLKNCNVYNRLTHDAEIDISEVKKTRLEEELKNMIQLEEDRYKAFKVEIDKMKKAQKLEYEEAINATHEMHIAEQETLENLLHDAVAKQENDEAEIIRAAVASSEDIYKQAMSQALSLNRQIVKNYNDKLRKEREDTDTKISQLRELYEGQQSTTTEFVTLSTARKGHMISNIEGALVELGDKYSETKQYLSDEYERFIKESDAAFGEVKGAMLEEKDVFNASIAEQVVEVEDNCSRATYAIEELRKQAREEYANSVEQNKINNAEILNESRNKLSVNNLRKNDLIREKTNYNISEENILNQQAQRASNLRNGALSNSESLKTQTYKWLLKNGVVDYDARWWLMPERA